MHSDNAFFYLFSFAQHYICEAPRGLGFMLLLCNIPLFDHILYLFNPLMDI